MTLNTASEATPTTLTEAAEQLSDDVFLLLLIGITVLPPLFLLFLPWQVARLQRRLSLGLQTLLGAGNCRSDCPMRFLQRLYVLWGGPMILLISPLSGVR